MIELTANEKLSEAQAKRLFSLQQAFQEENAALKRIPIRILDLFLDDQARHHDWLRDLQKREEPEDSPEFIECLANLESLEKAIVAVAVALNIKL